MPRLIALALDPACPVRMTAINALPINRTDESVAALKKLIADPDPTVRQTTEEAIRDAYRRSGIFKGRPLRKDDFPPELQQDEHHPAK